MHKLTLFLLGTSVVVSVLGCGGSGNSTLTGANNPRIQAVNAFNTNQAVDVYYNQDKIAQNLAFGATSATAIEPNVTPTVSFDATGTLTPIAQQTGQTFRLNSNYVVVGTNAPNVSGGSGTTPVVFTIPLITQAMATQAQVRFITATAAVGDVNIYVTPPGASIDAATTPTAVVAASSLGTPTQMFALNPATYEIRVYPTNSTVTPLVDEQVTLSAGANRTFLLIANQLNQPSLVQLNDTTP